MTREEYLKSERESAFSKICPPEFNQPIKRSLLTNPAAFDAVANWDGKFPGPCASGETGSSKTRASWTALRRLIIGDAKSLTWFPVRKLIAEMARYEEIHLTEEFFKNCSYYGVLFVDDLDKFNAQFESEMTAVFAFYDFVYRNRRPCITTTNQSRKQWAGIMGEAFARRLFADASFHVQF